VEEISEWNMDATVVSKTTSQWDQPVTAAHTSNIMTNPNHMLTDVNNVITPAYNAKDHPKTTVFLVTEEPNSSTEKDQVLAKITVVTNLPQIVLKDGPKKLKTTTNFVSKMTGKLNLSHPQSPVSNKNHSSPTVNSLMDGPTSKKELYGLKILSHSHSKSLMI